MTTQAQQSNWKISHDQVSRAVASFQAQGKQVRKLPEQAMTESELAVWHYQASQLRIVKTEHEENML